MHLARSCVYMCIYICAVVSRSIFCAVDVSIAGWRRLALPRRSKPVEINTYKPRSTDGKLTGFPSNGEISRCWTGIIGFWKDGCLLRYSLVFYNNYISMRVVIGISERI